MCYTPTMRTYLKLHLGKETALFRLDPERMFVLGRACVSDVVVKDERISRKHGSVEWSATNDSWFYTDMGSTNGTYVCDSMGKNSFDWMEDKFPNDLRKLAATKLAGGQRHYLREGDAIMLGSKEYWFELVFRQ